MPKPCEKVQITVFFHVVAEFQCNKRKLEKQIFYPSCFSRLSRTCCGDHRKTGTRSQNGRRFHTFNLFGFQVCINFLFNCKITKKNDFNFFIVKILNRCVFMKRMVKNKYDSSRLVFSPLSIFNFFPRMSCKATF